MVRLVGAAEFLRGIPFILGFTPVRSLIVAMLDGAELGAVMRVDLDGADGNLDQLVATAGCAAGDKALVVVVDADGFGCAPCAGERGVLLSRLTAGLRMAGVEVCASLVVDEMVAGGRWCSAGDEASVHRLGDPATSQLAMRTVLSGRQVRGGRAELLSLVQVESDRASAVMALVEATDVVTDVEEAVATALGAVQVLVAGGGVSDDVLAAVAVSLRSGAVRDRLYGLALSDCAGGAETLWALLARVLWGKWRAEALVLLGLSAYVRGDGPLVGVAVSAALDAVRGHRMALLLEVALRGAVPPERVREVVARSVGVVGRG